jgi:hypothetical protein
MIPNLKVVIPKTEPQLLSKFLGFSFPHSSSPLNQTHVLHAQATQSPHCINPTNTNTNHKALNLMGAVLTCLGLSSSAIKKSRDKKKASQTGSNNGSAPQPLPPQAASQAGAESQSVKDAQQALEDEHLATISPIEPTREHRAETDAAGITEVQKDVATAAPLPTA